MLGPPPRNELTPGEMAPATLEPSPKKAAASELPAMELPAPANAPERSADDAADIPSRKDFERLPPVKGAPATDKDKASADDSDEDAGADADDNEPEEDEDKSAEAEDAAEDDSDEEDEPGDAAGDKKEDGSFPMLPPDPYEKKEDELPPLEAELFEHGGSYLYQVEGDRLGWPDGEPPRGEWLCPDGKCQGHHGRVHRYEPAGPVHHGGHGGGLHGGHDAGGHGLLHHGHHGHDACEDEHCDACGDGHAEEHGAHYEFLRLPECFQKPRPLEGWPGFLDPGPILPWGQWLSCCGCGNVWEPQFTGHGSFSLFGFAFGNDLDDQAAIGAQLLLDLDLRLTGTERFHVQYRPIGERGTGGSYYQFSDPDGWVDNSTATPDRYWFEMEVESVFGRFLGATQPLDYHIAAGRFPFQLHNSLLMNDDVTGVVVNKNNIYFADFSNLNIQLLAAFDDVDTFGDEEGRVFGTHLTADRHHVFWEASYMFSQHRNRSLFDAHYLAASRTQLFGPMTVAGRGFLRVGKETAPRQEEVSGLLVLETNYTRVFDSKPLDIEHGVFFANAFYVSDGWSPIAGGNFNRLTTAFEVNPLINIASGRQAGVHDVGLSAGVQLFRHHEDESFVPEISITAPGGEAVFGAGLRYLLKTGHRSFFEALGVLNFSRDPALERRGVFIRETWVF